MAIIATFGLTGPEQCSNLPVQRYSPCHAGRDRVAAALRTGLLMPLTSSPITTPIDTPKGNAQNFQFSLFFAKKGSYHHENRQGLRPRLQPLRGHRATMVQEAAGTSWVSRSRSRKVTDAKSIAMAGVMSTPGIAVDGKLVHAGGLPDAAKLDGWLTA